MSEVIKLAAMVVRHGGEEWSDQTRDAIVEQATKARDEHDAMKAEVEASKECCARRLTAEKEVERLRAETAELKSKLKRQAALIEEGWDDVPVVDILELRAESMKLRETYAAAHEAHLKIQGENERLQQSLSAAQQFNRELAQRLEAERCPECER